jgi:hypothetical protein
MTDGVNPRRNHVESLRSTNILSIESSPYLEKHLLPSASVELRHSAVGVTGNRLRHIQSSSVLQIVLTINGNWHILSAPCSRAHLLAYFSTHL